MDDDEYLESMTTDKPEWQYHEVCLWLPHKPETVEDIANDMAANGFRLDRAIATYEGKILDGRHRYEAALQAGVDPVFVEFQGTKEGAIAYVTSENVARRHLNNKEKEFFYVQRAEALGVNHRGGDRKSEEAKINPTNVGMVPSAKDHAEAIGVTDRTVERWEADRKEIKSDPELAAKAVTPEGYQEAKAEVKKRRNVVVPDYRVDDAMGAIKGIAELFNKRFAGTKEEAASVLVSELIKGCETDDIGLSIARDYVKWFMSLKEVMDIAEPTLSRFLNEQPNLKVV
jgi:ParB-like chromosome segregation protein Spo0J